MSINLPEGRLMNWLDMVFITLVIACGAVGVWIGLIRAALSALGLVLGILVASQVSEWTLEWGPPLALKW